MLFSILLVASCGYALAAGGWPERSVAWTNMIGSVLSLLIALDPSTRWMHGMGAMWLIDLSVCATFLMVAANSDRFWPIWNFGFSIASLMAHLAHALQPELPFMAYFRSEAVWVYPALATMVLGTWQHQRDRRTGIC